MRTEPTEPLNHLQQAVSDQYTGVPTGGLPPGSDAWRTTITATKIAAILGVDGFGTTRYTMWHQIAGNYDPPFRGNSATRRGTCLESGIAKWWKWEHEGYEMEPAGGWCHPDHDWAFATPDFIVRPEGGDPELLEIKSSARMNGFGDPSRGVIPPHYWAQIAWQCLVTGVPVVNLTVLGTWLERHDYRFEFDQFVLDSILEEVQGFVDTLPGGPNEWEPLPEDPTLDWETILAVTPVTKEEVDVSALYPEYAEAKRREKAAKAEAEEVRKRIMAQAASADVAVAGGSVVASRNKVGSFTFKPVKDTPT